MSQPEPDALEDASIFDEEDREWDAQRTAEAEADIAAGRVVPHQEVAKWLETWGTPEFRPMPRSWLK